MPDLSSQYPDYLPAQGGTIIAGPNVNSVVTAAAPTVVAAGGTVIAFVRDIFHIGASDLVKLDNETMQISETDAAGSLVVVKQDFEVRNPAGSKVVRLIGVPPFLVTCPGVANASGPKFWAIPEEIHGLDVGAEGDAPILIDSSGPATLSGNIAVHAEVIVHNTDAANPHSFNMQLSLRRRLIGGIGGP